MVTTGATRRPDEFAIPQPASWRARGCKGGVCDQPVFMPEKAADPDPYANRYLAFTGGDHGYQRIENLDPAAHGTIMLVKDSFGDALTTYLAERVSSLITIDERHYTGGRPAQGRRRPEARTWSSSCTTRSACGNLAGADPPGAGGHGGDQGEPPTQAPQGDG